MSVTQRFSNRVADYDAYRPDYPAALLDLLGPACTILEVGAGTGILSEQLLGRGHRVLAVEPNAPMRQAAEDKLRHHAGFSAHPGTAEETGVDGPVDLVLAAQAFHWFDAQRAAAEARRLAPRACLIWNNRVAETAERFTPGMAAYEQLLLDHGTDYRQVLRHEDDIWARIHTFFGWPIDAIRLPHEQRLDRAGVHGRVRSCSYVPAQGAPGFDEMTHAIDALVDEHGPITLNYETVVVLGPLR